MKKDRNNSEISEKYDVALSFAGEQREYVMEVAKCLKGIYGLKVFFDEFEETQMWGKNLTEYLYKIFSEKSKYVILFISNEYLKKKFPKLEMKASIQKQFEKSKEYILLIKFGKVKLPSILKDIKYLNGDTISPYEVAMKFAEKIGILEKDIWFGKWIRGLTSEIPPGELFIYKVGEDDFEFNLYVCHGGHIGEIRGNARFIDKNKRKAVWEELIKENDKNVIAELYFYKMHNCIVLQGNTGCRYFCGAGAHFEGKYMLKEYSFHRIEEMTNDLFSKMYAQIMNEVILEELSKCFLAMNKEKKGEKIIIEGWVPGLYPCYSGILIIHYKEIRGCINNCELNNKYVYWFASDDFLDEEIKNWVQNHKKKLKKIEEIKK